MKLYGMEIEVGTTGSVKWAIDNSGARVYPYKWSKDYNCWTNCSGWHSPSYIRQMMREDRCIFR